MEEELRTKDDGQTRSVMFVMMLWYCLVLSLGRKNKKDEKWKRVEKRVETWEEGRRER